MTHNMKLQEVYFNYILHGTKRIELRLFDEKRQQIKLGDTVTFRKEPDLADSFSAKVVGLLHYSSFNELLEDIDMAILADKSMSKEELKNTLLKFYPLEKQEKYGVLGIRVELL